MNDRPQHGGSRPGAGRKPLSTSDDTVVIAITLTRELADKALRIGNGNRSEGIRQALAAYPESAD